MYSRQYIANYFKLMNSTCGPVVRFVLDTFSKIPADRRSVLPGSFPKRVCNRLTVKDWRALSFRVTWTLPSSCLLSSTLASCWHSGTCLTFLNWFRFFGHGVHKLLLLLHGHPSSSAEGPTIRWCIVGTLPVDSDEGLWEEH
jgi:hypothetical protein